MATARAQRPGRPKYVLTTKGRELAPALIMLMKWGDRHYPTPHGPPRLTLHAGCGGNVGADFRCEPQVSRRAVDAPCGEVRITTTLVDIDPADIAIGLRVAPVFDHGADGVTLLRYRPVG